MPRNRLVSLTFLVLATSALVIQMAYWQAVLVTDLYKPYPNVDVPTSTLQVNLSNGVINPLSWVTLAVFVFAIIAASTSAVRSYGLLAMATTITLVAALMFEPLLSDVLGTGLYVVAFLGFLGLVRLHLGDTLDAREDGRAA